MVRTPFFGFAFALCLSAATAQAQERDPAAAREQLKQGYALKQEGKFAEALPFLNESLRLDPQLKTLINVADCLESLGRYGDALQRWIEARDRAGTEGNENFKGEAERRLAELEARMPRLKVVLSAGAPSGTEVLRDGVALGQVSLGAALPTDPGKHAITVRAPGREPRTLEVTLADRENKELEVAPGDAAGAKASAEPKPASEQPAMLAPTAAAPAADSRPGHGNTQRWIGIGLGGAGLLAFGVAGGTWALANSKHDEALDHCTPNCNDRARQLQADAVDVAKLTNVSVIAGSILAAGGVVVYLTAPRATARASVVPLIGPRFAGAVFTSALE